jgi:hypothetical protein
MRWPNDGRGAVEAFHALDWGDLRMACTSGPGVDRGRLIAGVDRELSQAKMRAMRMRKSGPIAGGAPPSFQNSRARRR